jgi:hypothetical protein
MAPMTQLEHTLQTDDDVCRADVFSGIRMTKSGRLRFVPKALDDTTKYGRHVDECKCSRCDNPQARNHIYTILRPRVTVR